MHDRSSSHDTAKHPQGYGTQNQYTALDTHLNISERCATGIFILGPSILTVYIDAAYT
jgi:hypothetical protein